MNYLERKYYANSKDILLDLSSNSLIDPLVPPMYLGRTVLISKNNNCLFVSSSKSVYNGSTNSHGDVFIYNYDTNTGTWSLETSLYTLAYSSISDHDFGGGTYIGNFGKSMCCNDANNILFVGMPGYRTTSTTHGCVCIFEYINSSWSFKQKILGTTTNNQFGNSVTCNGDGTMLFVGTNANTYNISDVYKFDLTNNSYVQDTTFSIKPVSDKANASFGNQIKCDISANILVVGSTDYAYSVNSTTYYTGSVHIFQNSSNTWSELKDCYPDISNNRPYSGATIANGANIGKSVSISDDASKIVFSTNIQGLSNGSSYGVIYYYEYDNSSQNYIFKEIITSPVYNSISTPFGDSIQISANGNYMIAAATGKYVEVYTYNPNLSNSTYWQQNQYTNTTQNIVTDLSNNLSFYSDIAGSDDIGNSLSISEDGNMIAIGAKDYYYDYSNGKITGMVMVMYSKQIPTITFSDATYGYGKDITLSAITNSNGTKTYSNPTGNTNIYTFKTGFTDVITMKGIGNNTLKVTVSEDNNYVENTETITITGRKAIQQINYIAAISTQGYIGIGQTSGITYSVLNQDSGNNSDLSANVTITGNHIQYNPVSNEVEGLSVGSANLTISQSGDSYHDAATDVTLLYTVQPGWSSAYPSGYNSGYTPTSTGLEFTEDNDLSSLTYSPELANISNLYNLGNYNRELNNNMIYGVKVSDNSVVNELKRTNMQRTNGLFNMTIKEIANDDVQYVAISLKDKVEIDNYQIMTSSNKELLKSIENPTDIFQIEKYREISSGVYEKQINDYVIARIYHPYDTLVMYHIDDSENVARVTSSTYSDSSIMRENEDSSYWYVKMPFSGAIGGTSSSETNMSGIICFPSDTYIKTDQGEVKIDKINPSYHTIRNKQIKGITCTTNIQRALVEIERNTFGENIPNRNLRISIFHKIYFKNAIIEAGRLVGMYPSTQIRLVSHTGLLYNVLLDTHSYMRANNCKVESLNPSHKIAILHEKVIWKKKYPENFTYGFIKDYNEKAKNQKYNKSISL